MPRAKKKNGKRIYLHCIKDDSVREFTDDGHKTNEPARSNQGRSIIEGALKKRMELDGKLVPIFYPQSDDDKQAFKMGESWMDPIELLVERQTWGEVQKAQMVPLLTQRAEKAAVSEANIDALFKREGADLTRRRAHTAAKASEKRQAASKKLEKAQGAA